MFFEHFSKLNYQRPVRARTVTVQRNFWLWLNSRLNIFVAQRIEFILFRPIHILEPRLTLLFRPNAADATAVFWVCHMMLISIHRNNRNDGMHGALSVHIISIIYGGEWRIADIYLCCWHVVMCHLRCFHVSSKIARSTQAHSYHIYLLQPKALIHLHKSNRSTIIW